MRHTAVKAQHTNCRSVPAELDEKILLDLPRMRNYCTSIEDLTNGRIGDSFLHIGGPCAIESVSSLRLIAESVRSCNVRVLRGGAFKHRTLPYTFAGIGEDALRIHHTVARDLGMLTISEIMEAEQLNLFREYVDIIQIGSRNMRNYSLFKHVANTGKPVVLKRDMAATMFEWLAAGEHLLTLGVQQLALCERGVRWHDSAFRNLLDLNSVAWIKRYLSLPILVDPSHALGRPDLIEALSMAAVSCGADGLMIEVHHCPASAKCDAQQAITPDVYAEICSGVAKLREFLHSSSHSINLVRG